MEAVQHISTIEEAFFRNGISKTGGNRVIHAALRYRFTFLAAMCGLLRGETLFKAELSDVFQIVVKKDEYPHPLFVMMMQFSTGKVNQGCGYSSFLTTIWNTSDNSALNSVSPCNNPHIVARNVKRSRSVA